MSTNPNHSAPRPSSIWPTILLFAAIAGILFAISRFSATRGDHNAGREHPAVGKAAPTVEFVALTGKQGIRLADQKGKVVLINFWGTWCPPCREEFPRLQQVTKSLLSRDDFVFASVCVPGGNESREEVAADAASFLKQNSAAFDAVYDEDSKAFGALLAAVGARSAAVPFTTIVDRAGKIAGVWIGYESGDEEEVAKVLAPALAK